MALANTPVKPMPRSRHMSATGTMPISMPPGLLAPPSSTSPGSCPRWTDCWPDEAVEFRSPRSKKAPADVMTSLSLAGRMLTGYEGTHAVLRLTDAKSVTGEVPHVDGGSHRGHW